MWALIPNWLKIAAVTIAGAAVLSIASFQIGKREGRSATQIEAAKEALDRINNLEKNNASFRNLTDRGRCLVFMRDSGLPDSACD
ncbi:hypothetical protein AGRHK599_LOCUS1189 [Rhizobium rhizogenes]|uniref:Uncharacterized protein n=1 Tax=Rhizobium rhizogenes TaxID=359 RepID=A0AAN2A1H9_RHIRH|nr:MULTISPECIES: hypothetical protein [Rhizobium/Agrobacterium group]AQS61807.1 hypothetical protein B0909_05740 [Rhizobium rhizogenes]MCZ7442963.1 hypothetical protein [Rhizobium rhizogenes]NSZ78952.1 hypothetical protein [Agrobacterium tumefaciens]OAM65746.1 hypothetical protein A8L48_22385 [Rhizobium rhizogenes]CAD0211164.1 hypothetical protein AGRHK599_LOCUS1189 [Rhizobium rhizogenes]